MLVSNKIRNCPLCGERIGSVESDARDVYRISCNVCGEYRITEEAAGLLARRSEEERRILSGRACENVEVGLPPLAIHEKNIDELINDARVPRTPVEKMDRLLLSYYRRSGSAGAVVPYDAQQGLARAYASSTEEYTFLFDNLKDQGLIESKVGMPGWRLTMKGWERVLQLESVAPRSNQCFVAMWFDPSLEGAFNDGIRKAIQESGYEALRVDLREHNEKICDVIIAEIRRSGLMVADCTGHRQGVYFEAGFAMGLGIPCIFTCREDDIGKAHFDTRQYNHIVWKDPEDLRNKLLRRILATVPPKSTGGQ